MPTSAHLRERPFQELVVKLEAVEHDRLDG